MKDVYYSNTEIDVLDLASSSNLYYSYGRRAFLSFFFFEREL